jgi:HPt (histidine-containing phosphotransfer) domain-containing protein
MAAPVSPDATAASLQPDASLDLERFDFLSEICAASGSPTTIEALVEAFVEDGHRRVTEMEGFLHAGDLPELASLAHELRGSSATIGAVALSDAVAGLQRRALEAGNRPAELSDSNDLGRLVRQTAVEFRRAEIALRAAAPKRR